MLQCKLKLVARWSLATALLLSGARFGVNGALDQQVKDLPADASARQVKQLVLYKALGDLRAFDFPMWTMALSADGKWLAASDLHTGPQLPLTTRPRLMVVDVASGQPIHVLDGHEQYPNQLRFSPDGKTLYSGGHPGNSRPWNYDRRLYVWDVALGTNLKQFQAGLWDLSPDGKVLALVVNAIRENGFVVGEKLKGPSFTVSLLDTVTWKEVSRHDFKEANLAAFSFAADGKSLALAVVPDFNVRIWEWKANKEIGRLQLPKPDQKNGFEEIMSIVCHPDGNRLAVVTDDFTRHPANEPNISIWDIKAGKVSQKFKGAGGPISALAFTPKGDRLVVRDIDVRASGFHVFDMVSGKRLADYGGINPLTYLATVPNVVGKRADHMANPPQLMKALWDPAKGTMTNTPPHLMKKRQETCLATAPDDRTVAVGESFGIIRLWDAIIGKEIVSFADPTKAEVEHLVFAEAGKCLLSKHSDGKIHVWNVATGKEIEGLPRAADRLHGPTISADGKIACAIRDTEFVMVWQNLGDKNPKKFKMPSSDSSLQFTRDGKFLVTGRWRNGPVHVVNVAAGKVVRSIGRDNVEAFAVSPDGRTLATFERSADFKNQSILLWNLSTGVEQCQIAQNKFPGQALQNDGMRFTPDGRGLLVYTHSGLGIWEVATGQNRVTIGGGGGTGFTKSGRLVCSQGPNCVLVWDLTGRNQGGPLDKTPISNDEMAKLWTALHGDADQSYAAIWRLAGVPEQTVTFLSQKIQDLEAPNPNRVANLIADLDSDKFATREKAMAELPKYGSQALKETKAALAKSPPLEMEIRLKALLPKLRDYPTSAEEVEAFRVVEVLEQCATPKARNLLEKLETGNNPVLNEPARAALGRWPKS
ncbi:MAG TPA: WD40 repeat domain-containing protein [Gemmataceae bacterium]|nr:WD40 repeat domain-containing protein [Gemmataceae bacterium]